MMYRTSQLHQIVLDFISTLHLILKKEVTNFSFYDFFFFGFLG